MKQNFQRWPDVQQHLNALWKELSTTVTEQNEKGEDITVEVPPSEEVKKVISAIVHIRRGIDPQHHVIQFHIQLKGDYKKLFSQLDTRWLVSIADTCADTMQYGGATEAIIISTYANVIKLGETYRLYSNSQYQKPNRWEPHILWDGVSNFNVYGGDMPTNLYRRINASISNPMLKALFAEVKSRLNGSGTYMEQLGAL